MSKNDLVMIKYEKPSNKKRLSSIEFNKRIIICSELNIERV